MMKSIGIAGALAAAALATATAASAHTAGEVEEILENHGYSRIQFTSTNPQNYMANACRDGVRYHFHVNNYGEVTQRREIGSCGIVRAHRDYDEDGDNNGYRRHRSGGWGHRWANWRHRWE